MSHELDFTRGKAAMVYCGEVPWHSHGTRIDTYCTTAEALRLASLDFEVFKAPMYAHIPNIKTVPTGNGGFKQVPRDTNTSALIKVQAVPGRWAVVREDTGRPFAGVAVGDRWTPLQNKDGAAVLDAIVQEKAAIIETAGAIKGGRQVWMLARLDGVVRVKGEDVSKTYLLWTNGHDGQRAITYGLTTVRVVCNNTLTAALGSMNSVCRFRHDGKVGQRVVEVREALGLVNKSLADLEAKMNALASVQVKGESDLDTFLRRLGFDPDADKGAEAERALAIKHSFVQGPGSNLSSAKGTWWGAVCAVTDVVDHYGERDTPAKAERVFASTMLGRGNAIKTEAMNTALVLAGV